MAKPILVFGCFDLHQLPDVDVGFACLVMYAELITITCNVEALLFTVISLAALVVG